MWRLIGYGQNQVIVSVEEDMGKTGRPPDIDAWRQRQYLDLERRRLHIAPGSITRSMLADDLKIETDFPIGVYGGKYLTITSRGKPVFGNILDAGGKYGMCVYGVGYSIYGWEIAYGAAAYGTSRYGGGAGSDYGLGLYGRAIYDGGNIQADGLVGLYGKATYL